MSKTASISPKLTPEQERNKHLADLPPEIARLVKIMSKKYVETILERKINELNTSKLQ